MQPVKIGDTLHVNFEVIAKQEKDERRGIVHFRQLIKNQRGEDVSVAIFKLMFAKK
jgi:acyl dehydratase